MDRIFVTGDTHGNYDIDKLMQLHELNLTYDDYLIILGDAGIVWDNDVRDKALRNWYKRNVDCSVLFVDGNHESHFGLNNLPVSIWNGGNIHVINEQIKHLMRGQVFTISNKTFFTFGGAESVDKMYRTENVSWWKEEMPSEEEYLTGKKNCDVIGNKVDFVLTHDVPAMFLEEVITNHYKANPNKLNHYLDWVYENVEFKKFYSGHHHNDAIVNNKLRVLYNDVIEIK